jgi:hypothetical protein
VRRPHPLFWLTLAFLVLSVVIAATAHARAPGYALNSGAVYRIELALAVLVAAYAAFSLLALAFAGRPLQRFELPGGAAAEASLEPLGRAAGEFAEFRDRVLDQLEDIDQALGDLDARINDLESGVNSGS